MNSAVSFIQRSFWRPAAALALATALVGCGKEDIAVYRVSKEKPETAAMENPHSGNPPAGNPRATSSAQPQLTWKTPAGWAEAAPSELRVASFKIKGADGKQADVSVIPLSGTAGGDLNNVNRWRGQVGQAAVTQEELAKLAEPVEIAGDKASLFDQAGQPPSAEAKLRILGVVLHRDDMAWFFKMTGDDQVVAVQKTAFVEFLKSVQFQAPDATASLPASHPPIGGSAPDMQAGLPPSHPPIGGASPMFSSPSSATKSSDKPSWTVPSSWKEEPATQMLLAKFSATDKDTRAEITVSAFPGDVGGLLANVNRWRRQIGLAPIDETGLAQAVTNLDLQSDKGSLVELDGTDPKSGQKARLIGVAVPHGGQTWFFKMMGDGSVVAREKDAFLKFVQSVKFPNAA